MSGSRTRLLTLVTLLFVTGVCLVLLAGARFRQTCLPLDTEEVGTVQVGWLAQPGEVVQEFRALHDGLSGVTFRLVQPSPGKQLVVSLFPGGTDVGGNGWVAEVPAGEGVYALTFPPEVYSAGEKYLLALHSSDFSNDQQPSLWVHRSDVNPGKLELGGNSVPGDLVFGTCYNPPSLHGKYQYVLEQLWSQYPTLDTLLNRMSQYKPLLLKRPQLTLLWVAAGVAANWLVVFTVGQLSCSKAWSAGRAFFLSFSITAMALVMLGGYPFWVASLEPTEQMRARPSSDPPVLTANSRLAYDFLFETISNPAVRIDSPEDWYTGLDWAIIDTMSRPVIRMHPPSTISHELIVPQNAYLRGAAALDPQVWSPDKGDGVVFQVLLLDEEGEHSIFYREIDPKNKPEDRRWHDFEVDLSQYAGSRVTIRFLTYPMQSNDWDWAIWGAPVLISRLI